MRAKARWLIMLAVMLIYATGCGGNSDNGSTDDNDESYASALNTVAEHETGLPSRLLEIIEENRKVAFPLPVANFEQVLQNFMTPNLDADRDAEIAELIRIYRESDVEQPYYLSQEQMTYEINFLFDVLRYGYGAYQHFGGDEVFFAMRDALLEQLAQESDMLQLGTYLHEILLPAFADVIADNHFWLEGHRLWAGSQLYMNGTYVVRESDVGFIVEIRGTSYAITSTKLSDGRDVAGLLPTLTREGELAWAFGHVEYGLHVHELRNMLQMVATLTNIETGESREHILMLHSVRDASGQGPEKSWRDGVPILRNWVLQDRSFVCTAETVRDEPVLVLDLRGHNGGNDGLALEWLYRYSGHQPIYSMLFAHLRLNSAVVREMTPWLPSAPSGSQPEWTLFETPSRREIIPNDRLVIVLTCNSIGSAGDTFVGYMRQMENVLIVGVNTRGVLVTGNVAEVVLPYSRFSVHFGVSLNIRPDLSQFEGVGFAPDLWVDPAESLDRVFRFIERYGLADGMRE